MSDLDTALALNNAHKVETGFLTTPELAALLSSAFHAVAQADQLLITLDQDAAYDSPNFRWFKTQYARFVYIDRVIVVPQARGQGLARTLYLGLFAQARAAGHDRIVCEINLDPPNPGSLAFHDALGFVEVGRALLANGKTVSYRMLSLG
ncbi:MAG: hypothetical protein RL367_1548 [Pseudomonadota bacterium]